MIPWPTLKSCYYLIIYQIFVVYPTRTPGEELATMVVFLSLPCVSLRGTRRREGDGVASFYSFPCTQKKTHGEENVPFDGMKTELRFSSPGVCI
jgi:hypothetical protein